MVEKKSLCMKISTLNFDFFFPMTENQKPQGL